MSLIQELKTTTAEVSAGENNTHEALFTIAVDNHLSAYAKDGTDIHANPGEDVQLSVVVEADNKNDLQYYWYDPDNSEITDASSDTLTISNIQKSGQYHCEIKDAYNNWEYVYFTVIIETGLEAYAVGAEPGDSWDQYNWKYIQQGQTWDMGVTVECPPDVRYDIAWYRYTTQEDDGYTFLDWVKVENANSTQYSASDFEAETQYKCVVTDEYGNYRNVYFCNGLTAVAKGYGKSSVNIEVPYNSEKTLEVEVPAIGEVNDLTYQWYQTIDYPDYVERGPISGATSAALTIPAVTGHLDYECVVTNASGQTSNVHFYIDVLTDYTIYAVGSDYSDIATIYAQADEELDLEVGVENGSDEGFSYQWYVYTNTNGSGNYQFLEGANQRIYHAEIKEGTYFYTCYVKDRFGKAVHITFNIKIEDQHEWGDVVYEWLEDHTAITATRVCQKNSNHVETETVQATSEIIKAATCTETGTIRYTATFANDAFEEQVCEDEIHALGHDWSLQETREDGTQIFVCSHNESEIREVKPMTVKEDLIDNQLGNSSKIKNVDASADANIRILEDSLVEATRDVLNEQENVIDEQTRDNLYQAIEAGDEIEAVIEVSSVVSAEDKNKIMQEVSEDYQVAVFVDLQIALYDQNQNALGTINQLTDELDITITVEPYDSSRTYYVFRMHDGEIERLDTVDHGDGRLTFRTSCFSSYAVSTAKPRIEDCEVRLDKTVYTYDGTAFEPSVQVLCNGEPLDGGEDYTVSYNSNVNAGTAVVTVNGIQTFAGTVEKTFEIRPADISCCGAYIEEIEPQTYTGEEIKPAPVVKLGSKTLARETEYTVSYAKNVNAGEEAAELTVTGTGNYTGSKTVKFTIAKVNQSITAKASVTSVAVGKTATITVTGAKGKVSYSSANTTIATVSTAGKITAKKVGTVNITVTSAATTNYNKTSKTITIKVVPAATSSVTAANLATGMKVTWKKVAGATGYKIYRNGTRIKTITNGNTLTYTDTKANTNGGKYTFKVVAYAGSGDSTLYKSVVYYRIARPTISSLTSPKTRQMLVKWGRNAKATGYVIQYSTNSKFASGNRSVTVKGAATVSRTISSLTAKKRYYVRIRTYKTVSGKNYYSAWSAVKKVVTK